METGSKDYGKRKILYRVKILPDRWIEMEVLHHNKSVRSLLKRYKDNPSGLLNFLPYYEKGDPRALYWLAKVMRDFEDSFRKDRVKIVFKNEESALPFYKEIPKKEEKEISSPQWLTGLVEKIKLLQGKSSHSEREHEVLVENFFELLGYKSLEDIKFQEEKADLLIEKNGKPVIVVEVKRDWGLKQRTFLVLKQAYDYAQRLGARYVVITNGNYYEIYDRAKGMSYKDHYLGSFSLLSLTLEGEKLIEVLKNPEIEDKKQNCEIDKSILIFSPCSAGKDDSVEILSEEKIVKPEEYLKDEFLLQKFLNVRKEILSLEEARIGKRITYAFDLYVRKGKAYREIYLPESGKLYKKLKALMKESSKLQWFFLSGGYGVIHALERAHKYQATFSYSIAHIKNIPCTQRKWEGVLEEVIEEIVKNISPDYIYGFGSENYTYFLKNTTLYKEKENIKIFESTGSAGPAWLASIIRKLVEGIFSGEIEEFNKTYPDKFYKQGRSSGPFSQRLL